MIDDYYFRNIDTENKAYFVGYLLADGCITKSSHANARYNVIQLHLAFKDYAVVELLQSETSNTRKIYVDKKQTRCMYRASSDIMVADLARFGIVPRKTGSEQPNFELIPAELLRHTVRGLIDDDGWISITDFRGRKVTSVGICGSYYTCEYVTSILAKYAGVNILNPSKVKDKDCYKISYTSLSDAKKIIRYLYEGANTFLYRKYEHAIEIMSM